jgi:hypothetical protein
VCSEIRQSGVSLGQLVLGVRLKILLTLGLSSELRINLMISSSVAVLNWPALCSSSCYFVVQPLTRLLFINAYNVTEFRCS